MTVMRAETDIHCMPLRNLALPSLSPGNNSTMDEQTHILPGAFLHEDEDEDRHDTNENEWDEAEAKDRALQTKPLDSPRGSTRIEMQQGQT